MTRYATIWQTIKQKGTAEVVVHKDRVHFVKYGVIDTKARDNAARKKVGLIKYPELVFNETRLNDYKVKLTISLLYQIDI